MYKFVTNTCHLNTYKLQVGHENYLISKKINYTWHHFITAMPDWRNVTLAIKWPYMPPMQNYSVANICRQTSWPCFFTYFPSHPVSVWPLLTCKKLAHLVRLHILHRTTTHSTQNLTPEVLQFDSKLRNLTLQRTRTCWGMSNHCVTQDREWYWKSLEKNHGICWCWYFWWYFDSPS